VGARRHQGCPRRHGPGPGPALISRSESERDAAADGQITRHKEATARTGKNGMENVETEESRAECRRGAKGRRGRWKLTPPRPHEDGHLARSTAARPKARCFSLAQTQPDPLTTVPGLARPVCRARAWAACWGSGPAHVRVSGLLCGLEEFFVNTASTRGSEENSHQGLGGKSPSTPIPIYRRVFVIDEREQ
jgi:hypothetical protein